jgi:hypothetical protein
MATPELLQSFTCTTTAMALQDLPCFIYYTTHRQFLMKINPYISSHPDCGSAGLIVPPFPRAARIVETSSHREHARLGHSAHTYMSS